jgi:hypothetical protein
MFGRLYWKHRGKCYSWIASPKREGQRLGNPFGRGWCGGRRFGRSADDPKFAQVHMMEADEMRLRFDRAYAARKAADYEIPLGRGVWVSLYDRDSTDPVTHVGAGAGLDHPPIARVQLEPEASDIGAETKGSDNSDKPLTIGEAKRRLAMTLGVDPSNIKITVEA